MLKNKDYIEIKGKNYYIYSNTLDFSDLLIGNKWIIELSEKIIYKAKVENLFLIQNDFDDKWLEPLIKSLKIHDSVKMLDLSYNFIKGDSFNFFKDYLSMTKNLEDINLSNNNITPDNMKILFDWIKNNRSLKSIDIFNNPLDISVVKKLRDVLIVNKWVQKISIDFYNLWLQAAKEFLNLFKYRSNLEIIYK